MIRSGGDAKQVFVYVALLSGICIFHTEFMAGLPRWEDSVAEISVGRGGGPPPPPNPPPSRKFDEFLTEI